MMQFEEVINGYWWDVEQELFSDALTEGHAGSSSSNRNESPGLAALENAEKNNGTAGNSFVSTLMGKVDLDLDFAWMDEKMDLTILDDLESQPNHLDDPLVMDGDTAALLASWMEEEPDLWNSELPINEIKNTALVVNDNYDTPPATPPNSPESIVPDVGNLQPDQIVAKHPVSDLSNSHSSSFSVTPSVSLSQIESPEYVVVSVKDEDNFSDSVLSGRSSPIIESGSESICYDSPEGSPLSVQVTLTVGNSKTDDSKTDVTPMIHSNKRYKPYSLSSALSPKQQGSLLKNQSLKVVSGQKAAVDERKHRKKVQNKDAATRYRVKKRAECDALQEEEGKLLDQNQTLKDKVQQLSSEVSYLKGLMREMFRARGVLK